MHVNIYFVKHKRHGLSSAVVHTVASSHRADDSCPCVVAGYVVKPAVGISRCSGQSWSFAAFHRRIRAATLLKGPICRTQRCQAYVAPVRPPRIKEAPDQETAQRAPGIVLSRRLSMTWAFAYKWPRQVPPSRALQLSDAERDAALVQEIGHHLPTSFFTTSTTASPGNTSSATESARPIRT